MGDIDLGAAQLIAFDVTDETGALANASNVTLTVTSPDGVTDYVPVTNPPDVTGAYRVTYLPAAAGHYEWSAVTTVPNAAYGDSFNVRAWRSILSLADARDYLDLRDTSRDNVLRATLAGITQLIERQIGTCVIKPVTGEWIPGDVRDMLRLPSGPVPTATSVTSVASVYPQGPTWTDRRPDRQPGRGDRPARVAAAVLVRPVDVDRHRRAGRVPPRRHRRRQSGPVRPVGAAARRVRGLAGAVDGRSVHI